jgi:hypothetical protein
MNWPPTEDKLQAIAQAVTAIAPQPHGPYSATFHEIPQPFIPWEDEDGEQGIVQWIRIKDGASSPLGWHFDVQIRDGILDLTWDNGDPGAGLPTWTGQEWIDLNDREAIAPPDRVIENFAKAIWTAIAPILGHPIPTP